MGIVVCIAMLLGVVTMLRRSVHSTERPAHIVLRIARLAVPTGLFLLGIWNAFWYGIENIHLFWGKAALGSGLFMITASIIIFGDSQRGYSPHSEDRDSALMSWLYRLLNPLRGIVLLGLGLSFLLYFITLVQLNLGYPIIR